MELSFLAILKLEPKGGLNFTQEIEIVCITDNVHLVRAEVNEKTITKYLKNLEKELNGVTPGRIFNYDTTNVTDDGPGAKMVNINIFFYLH